MLHIIEQPSSDPRQRRSHYAYPCLCFFTTRSPSIGCPRLSLLRNPAGTDSKASFSMMLVMSFRETGTRLSSSCRLPLVVWGKTNGVKWWTRIMCWQSSMKSRNTCIVFRQTKSGHPRSRPFWINKGAAANQLDLWMTYSLHGPVRFAPRSYSDDPRVPSWALVVRLKRSAYT
jgi:hypothetical protein